MKATTILLALAAAICTAPIAAAQVKSVGHPCQGRYDAGLFTSSAWKPGNAVRLDITALPRNFGRLPTSFLFAPGAAVNIDLTPIGATGCAQFVPNGFTVVPPTTATTRNASLTVTLPNDPKLIGLKFTVQGLYGALPFTGGIGTTNGLEITISK